MINVLIRALERDHHPAWYRAPIINLLLESREDADEICKIMSKCSEYSFVRYSVNGEAEFSYFSGGKLVDRKTGHDSPEDFVPTRK